MPIGLDVGTMHLVRGILGHNLEPEFIHLRNAYKQINPVAVTRQPSATKMYSILIDNKCYLLGDDAYQQSLQALDFVFDKNSTLRLDVGELGRPMRDGVLNMAFDQKCANKMLSFLLCDLLAQPSNIGKPIDRDVLCYTVPEKCAEQAHIGNDNVSFHLRFLNTLLGQQQFKYLFSVPEASAILDSERSPGNEAPNGLALSFGAGLCNVYYRYGAQQRGFSISQSGDWIDESVAKPLRMPVQEVTDYKERNLDLSKIPSGDMVAMALSMSYEIVIEHALDMFIYFARAGARTRELELDVLIAGGTAMVPGFLEVFKLKMDARKDKLPFSVREVKMARDPFRAVARGCLFRAMDEATKLGLTV